MPFFIGDDMFKINGIFWKIEYVRSNDQVLQRSDKSWTVGVTDVKTRTIYVADALRGSFKRKVLIHEICHACIFSYGIDIDLAQEERLCDFIASYGDEIFSIADSIFYGLKIAEYVR